MKLSEYITHDATSLAKLVRNGEVTPAELRACALDAIALTKASNGRHRISYEISVPLALKK